MKTTERCSDRVSDYARYRPGYPAGISELLAELGARPGRSVADFGSGTGILTQIILDLGADVWAVEPNEPMRVYAEARLGDREGYHSVNATAEASGLPAASMDLITAAQAFHWFEPAAAAREWRRILKRDGRIALVWNDRDVAGDEAMAAYEALLEEHGTDYGDVRHRPPEDAIAVLFGGAHEYAELANSQHLDRSGFMGRVFSSSYMPGPTHQRRAHAEKAVTDFFARYSEGRESIVLRYRTRVYYGAPRSE